MLYLDSNAIAKIYLTDEQGREAVFAALETCPTIATCAITYAEVMGLLARAFHDRRLSETEYNAAASAFAQEWSLLEVQDVTFLLSQLAGQLMKAQPGLRAMDALHLAAGLALRQSVALRFLTFDTRLENAVRKLMPEAVA